MGDAMVTNADITIYNTKINKVTKLPEYHRTQIKGVHVYVSQAISSDSNGARSADVYKIRIPPEADTGGKIYVSPSEYQDKENVSGFWTIQNEDIVVRAIVNDEITRQSEVLAKYKDESCRVKSWADNRFGDLPHWRIGGTR